MKNRQRLPSWLKRPLPAGNQYSRTNRILTDLKIKTICDDANCPNKGECWTRGTATALILGEICTRNCKFCSVASGTPKPVDPTEPARIAQMAKQMSLKYIVLTSVNRDDLADGGAAIFRDCIIETRKLCPEISFEILTPDFKGCQEKAIDILMPALPFVFAHNIETVPEKYPTTRSGGDYRGSLDLLTLAKKSFPNTQIKSSIMLGIGETDPQIEQTLKDIHNAGCDRITIGQYLKPSKLSLDVAEYVTPEKFQQWEQIAYDIGFSWVMSGPFVRSSYKAEQKQTR